MLIPIVEQIIAAGVMVFFVASCALILTSDWNPKADLQEALAGAFFWSHWCRLLYFAQVYK